MLCPKCQKDLEVNYDNPDVDPNIRMYYCFHCNFELTDKEFNLLRMVELMILNHTNKILERLIK
jgi:hypothetical protein